MDGNARKYALLLGSPASLPLSVPARSLSPQPTAAGERRRYGEEMREKLPGIGRPIEKGPRNSFYGMLIKDRGENER